MDAIFSILGVLVIGYIGFSILGVILGTIAGVFELIFGKSEKSAAPNPNMASREVSKPFSISAKTGAVAFGDDELPSITVSFKGAIELPRDAMECCFILLMRDITDEDKPGIIFSSVEELQEEETVFFQFTSRPEVIPYEHSVVSQLVSVASIPTDLLHFPKKGNRKLKLTLLLVNASNIPEIKYGSVVSSERNIYAVADTVLNYSNEVLGYVDVQEYSKRIEELSISLAMQVSGIDGEFHVSEGDLIREWVKKRIDSKQLSPEEIDEEKQRYNTYIKKAYMVAEEGKLDLEKCCTELKEKGSAADHYDVLELCMHVASADGKAESSELEIIKIISKLLNIDPNRFRELHDKILPIAVHVENQGEDTLLGINADMSEEEIRKHLNSEYRKWNSRVTHSDPKVREQADEMLRLISESRTRHVA